MAALVLSFSLTAPAIESRPGAPGSSPLAATRDPSAMTLLGLQRMYGTVTVMIPMLACAKRNPFAITSSADSFQASLPPASV